MNFTIEIAYLIASLIAVIAMVPQIKQLLITKQSDELSLSTWSAWAGCQVVSLLYGFSIGAFAYIIVNFVWIAFYILMVALIIRYRIKKPSLATELNAENPIEELSHNTEREGV
jgi:uncharacterized protein with PQ loop repeat